MNTISIIKSLLFSLQWLPKAKMVCGSSKITFKVPEQVVKLTLSVNNRAEVFQVESIVAPASDEKIGAVDQSISSSKFACFKDGERPISSLWKTQQEVPLTFDSFFVSIFSHKSLVETYKNQINFHVFRFFSFLMVWCREKMEVLCFLLRAN